MLYFHSYSYARLFKLGVTYSTISYNPEVPGFSVSYTEPPFLHHSVSTEIQRFRFQDGRVDAVPHGRCSTPVHVPYGIGGYSDIVIPSLSNFRI